MVTDARPAYLQTLTHVGVNQNTTLVFPLPIEMLRAFAAEPSRDGGGNGSGPRPVRNDSDA
jgi:hypothetical protein